MGEYSMADGDALWIKRLSRARALTLRAARHLASPRPVGPYSGEGVSMASNLGSIQTIAGRCRAAVDEWIVDLVGDESRSVAL